MEIGRHDHLRWNSGAISNNVSACGRLSARGNRLARLRRGERAKRRLHDRLRIDAQALAVRKGVGDLEPLAPTRRATPRCRRKSPSAPAAATTARRARPAPARMRTMSPGSPGRTQRRDDPFARPLDLGLLRRPGFGRRDQRLRHLLEVAVGVEKTLRQPIDERRRRVVGNEMARQLGRDVLRRRRMTREVGEHRAPLLDAVVGDKRCRSPSARRARARAAMKTNSPPWFGIRHGRQDRPAGQDLGEIGDVGLGVDGAHAERVQFEDFAREVLVEALGRD